MKCPTPEQEVITHDGIFSFVSLIDELNLDWEMDF